MTPLSAQYLRTQARFSACRKWLHACCFATALVGLGSEAAAISSDYLGDPLERTEAIDEQSLAPYTNATLLDALALIEQGKLDEAHARIARALESDPQSAPGHELMGIVLVLQGSVETGLEHLRRAVEINPGQSTAVTKIGDVYLAKGDTVRAKSQFQQAVALNPADRFAHQRLGMILDQEQDTDAAIHHYELGLRGTPAGYLGVKVDLGRLYNMKREFAKTRGLLEPVVKESSTNSMAHLVLGTAWFGSGEAARAAQAFERASALLPDVAGAHLALGIALREAGNPSRSLEELTKAADKVPNDPVASFHLAETLFALGRTDEAIERFSAAAATSPHPTPIRNRMAEVYASTQHLDKAFMTYRALQADGMADVRTYDGFVTLLQVRGQLGEAAEILAEACTRFPENTHMIFRLGMHQALVGDYAQASETLARAHTLAPADPRIRKALSLTAVRLGKLDVAIHEARELLKLVPSSTDDQFYLASLLEQADDPHAAGTLYATILDGNPGHLGALNNLAMIRLGEGRLNEALELAQRAAKVAPETPVVLDTLGWTLFKSGHLTESRATLQQAVDKGSGQSPTHRYHLAVVLQQLDDRTAALEQLDLALESKLTFPERDRAEKLAGELRQSRN